MKHEKIMTEEEAEAMDDFFTKNTIMPSPGKPGVLTRMKDSPEGLLFSFARLSLCGKKFLGASL
ncbi:hypothetical protein AGMMS50230_21260 [Spirochaetia bacterium]|nr:hypothetical protein AGMMS50230_21260 [Spirochaetia bacterium]